MMKALTKRPGFEAVFTLIVLLMVVIPAMVFAQQNKTLTIVVTNGDTLVNGQKIATLKQTEQKDAQKALAELGSSSSTYSRGYTHRPYQLTPPFIDSTHMLLQHKYMATGTPRVVGGLTVTGGRMDTSTKTQNYSRYHLDSTQKNGVTVYTDRRRDYEAAPDRIPTMRPDLRKYRMPNVVGTQNIPLTEYRRSRQPDFGAKQDFNYRTVDKNGIPTDVNFHISEASPEKTRTLSGGDKSTLDIADLVFLPIFSSGRTLIVCTLPNASPAEMSLLNDNGNVIFKEKTSTAQISKNVSMIMNGVYYLVIKQGALTAVRKVVKE